MQSDDPNSSNHYVFIADNEGMNTRFRDKTICYFKDKPQKEFLETIVGTKTRKYIAFQMAINCHWQGIIEEHLLFLGVNSNSIHLLSADNIYQNK